jgi:hypothetical protein
MRSNSMSWLVGCGTYRRQRQCVDTACSCACRVLRVQHPTHASSSGVAVSGHMAGWRLLQAAMARIGPGEARALAAISALAPASMGWSNVPDYLSPQVRWCRALCCRPSPPWLVQGSCCPPRLRRMPAAPWLHHLSPGPMTGPPHRNTVCVRAGIPPAGARLQLPGHAAPHARHELGAGARGSHALPACVLCYPCPTM